MLARVARRILIQEEGGDLGAAVAKSVFTLVLCYEPDAFFFFFNSKEAVVNKVKL